MAHIKWAVILPLPRNRGEVQQVTKTKERAEEWRASLSNSLGRKDLVVRDVIDTTRAGDVVRFVNV